MEGPNSENIFDAENNALLEDSGILPRIACFMAKNIRNDIFEFYISALEIYCDDIRDLFKDEESQVSTNTKSKNGQNLTFQGTKLINQNWVKISNVNFMA